MRKTKPKKRILSPDPRFGEQLVTQFVNNLMLSGKKSISYKIFYEAIDRVSAKQEEGSTTTGLDVWKKALNNTSPSVEVKSRRVGGATFQVPLEVRPGRKAALGMKWLIKAARNRHEKTMAQNLASEIIAASKGEGAAVKKKDDTHRMAEANKAFSHFRF